MPGELMQLIAYGTHNVFMSNTNMYSIGLSTFEMKKNIKDEIFLYDTTITITKTNDYYYSRMILGIIFEFDDLIMSNEYWKEKISDIVTKLKINIFTYMKIDIEEENDFVDTDKTLFIGSIPLYLADFKYIKNKIVVKFPSNFFSQYNYFLMYTKYKYELEIPKYNNNDDINLFKNICIVL